MVLRYLLINLLIFTVFQAVGQLDVQTLLLRHLDELSLQESDLRDLQITDQYSSFNNELIHTYLIQTFDGIPVKGARMSLATDPKGEFFYAPHNFISGLEKFELKGSFEMDKLEAFARTMEIKGIKYERDIREIEDEQGEPAYLANSVSEEEYIRIRKVFYVVKNSLHPAFEIDVFSDQLNEWWQFVVDASTGQLVDEIPWTIYCSFEHDGSCNNEDHNHNPSPKTSKVIPGPVSTASYNAMANTYQVFAMPLGDPDAGTRTIETAPWTNATNASPFGWHDTNGSPGAEFTECRGNNVRACEDRNANNTCGFSPNGGPLLDFQHPLNLNTENPVNYQDAAITNLFYWNNLTHDVWYQYGFDEPAGNFQENNYGNGGNQSDGVNADAQDGSGTNNANMSVPSDGSNPRMQMFEWTISGSLAVQVNSPGVIAGNYNASGANFGATTGIYTGDVVQTSPINACSAVTNGSAINGNIAMVDRGSCNFTNKVFNAQNVGAIAVIVCNNVSGNPITMGGSNGLINIPAVMLSMADCNTLKAQMPSPGVNTTINLDTPTRRDSDFDNTVIVHEYGHGISIRLAGGPGTSSCLNNNEQMGEGWSDWFGLMMTMETGDLDADNRGLGAYLTNEAPTSNGIRTYPYTTNLAANPHTYNDISSASIPHGIGSVWCAMLWEMTWGLIDEHGFDADFYNGTGGNNMAMELVIEGLKLQPCTPGFVDGRDAILAADVALNGGANQCIIWEAFAKRGLGFSASQGNSTSRSDGTEAFDIPTSCTEIMKITKTGPATATTAENIPYSVVASNCKSTSVANVMVRDITDSNLSLVPGTLSQGTMVGNLISYDQPLLNGLTDINITYSMESTLQDSSEVQLYDGFEPTHTSHWSPMTGQGAGFFVNSTNNPKRGSNNYFVPNQAANNTQYLLGNSMVLTTNPVLSFWHSYNTENGWDGGYVQISTNGGLSWNVILADEFILNDYDGTLGSGSNGDIAGKRAFTGNSNGYIRTIIDLSAYGSQFATIRFVFGSDDNTNNTGWYIDEVALYEGLNARNVACVTTATDPEICEEVNTLILPRCEDYNIYYIDADMDGYGAINSPDVYACSLMAGLAINKTDCNDNNNMVNPGILTDGCDGLDNDCDLMVDEDCTTNPCDGNIISIPVVTQNIYRAKTRIISDAIINKGSNIEYYAGVDICLDPGFEVEQGAEFFADIEDCQLPPFKEEETESKAKN